MGFKQRLSSLSENHPLDKAKLFYFFFHAATETMGYYLGLYYKHTLLLSPRQVSVLISTRSFCLLFGSPFLGKLADKLNRFRNVLLFCLFSYIITYVAIPLVEPVEGLNCQSHVKHSKYLHSMVKNASNPISIAPTGSSVLPDSDRFKVRFHGYKSEVDPYSGGYHGNLMWDLYYSWPMSIWGYTETERITRDVFITLLLITIVGQFFASPSATFADLYVLQMLRKDTNKFGLQIIPGRVGWLIVAVTFAVLTDKSVNLKDDFCRKGHVLNTSAYLYVFYGLIFVCIVIAYFFTYKRYDINDSDKECCSCMSVVPQVLFKPQHVAFLIATVFCGIGFGIKHLFIYHYITDLGGNVALLPAVQVVHFVSDVVALLLSPIILEKFGKMKVIYTGLFVYGVTFCVYSVIERPWLVFLVEPLDGICGKLSWVAIVTYVGSPPRVGAALQGIVHGMYRGFGMSIGSIAVGISILKFGYLTIFLVTGITFFVSVGIVLSIHHYYPPDKCLADEFENYLLLSDVAGESDYSDNEEDFVMNLTANQTADAMRPYAEDHLDTSFLKPNAN